MSSAPFIVQWLIGLSVATPMNGSNKQRDDVLASVTSDNKSDAPAKADAVIPGE
ncbi:MAG: hypothetical protein ACSLEN_14220 [Candidatus Malihini olakiniferum]